MPTRYIARFRREPTPVVSWVLFVLCVGLMAYLRLAIFPRTMLTLSYGLPLLICLVYPSRRLLWSMTGAFVVLAAYKEFFVLPEDYGMLARGIQWSMQLINMAAIGATVHLVLNLVERQRMQNFELARSNEALMARDAEISRQNEELQAQTEELAQHNEEIQQQAEEVQQQAEEIQAQAEELQHANTELTKREQIMELLVGSLAPENEDTDLPNRICRPVMALFGGKAVAVAVWEAAEGGGMTLLAGAGLGTDPQPPRLDNSLAGVVMQHNKTAFVEDFALRPDLFVVGAMDRTFCSALAAPLRSGSTAIGALEVYADRPQLWTAYEFKLLEWAAAQCSLILEVRRLHNELLRSNARLDALVTQRTAELQEMVNELEHFSYTITHDLRAPLRAMHGFAGMLADECQGKLDEQSQEYLRRIMTAAQRMDRLITDALAYSKTVREELALAPTEPVRLLRGMIDSYPAFQPPHAEILIDGEIPPVLANEAALTQCFSNLLGNAVKFVERPKTPRVCVRAEMANGFVRLWFEDNGIGIPTEMQSRVFLMFQRASKAFEGTGIGLALVRKVTERMGGRVGVQSEPGQGSRFWVELQAAEEART